MTATRLFIATPTASLQGGVERILEALASHLPSRGFEVVFGLAKGARFHDPDRFRAAYPVVKGVDVVSLSGTAYGRRRALVRAIREVDPDVVLIARLFDAYPAAAELKRAGHRLRLAVTVQAYESDYFVDLARYEPFVDVVIASGNLIASAASSISGVPAERVRSIPGGVAAATRFVAHDDARALRLGYVGRVEQVQKRILDLPLLADELRRRGIPFTCDVVGDGSALAELRARMPEARFHGWLSTGELYERVYPELDLLVHFAEWEGVTIAPREAMAHGVVPVVSRFTGLAIEEQFVEGSTALTFPVGDVAAAADAVERLHHDRSLLVRLSANARDSQTGIRSEQGAIDAWADAFRLALSLPARVGASLPAPPRDHGALSRIPAPVAEVVRRLRERPHASPGAEWPHWSGIRDEAIERRVADLARG